MVRTPQRSELVAALRTTDAQIDVGQDGRLQVHGASAEEIGEVAACHGIVLHELVARQASLEEAFMRLTGSAVEFHAAEPVPGREELEDKAA